METVAKVRADYIAELSNGKTVRVHDVEYEIMYVEGMGMQIAFHAKECEKIDMAISEVYPDYFFCEPTKVTHSP